MPERRETSALDVASSVVLRYSADPNWATRIDRSTQRLPLIPGVDCSAGIHITACVSSPEVC